MDIIDPELRSIRTRLAAAERSLAKKLGFNLLIGGFASACGLLAGVPLSMKIVASIIIPSTLNAVHKRIEEEKAIEFSDMYFIWKVMKHGQH